MISAVTSVENAMPRHYQWHAVAVPVSPQSAQGAAPAVRKPISAIHFVAMVYIRQYHHEAAYVLAIWCQLTLACRPAGHATSMTE